MKLESAVKLGMSVNLLHGFTPNWCFTQGMETPFFPVTGKPLKELDVEVNPTPAEWGFPEISLHASAEDLLSAVLPLSIPAPPDDEAAPKIRLGFLLIADKDRPAAIVSISKTLGADLLKTDYRSGRRHLSADD